MYWNTIELSWGWVDKTWEVVQKIPAQVGAWHVAIQVLKVRLLGALDKINVEATGYIACHFSITEMDPSTQTPPPPWAIQDTNSPALTLSKNAQ